MATIKKLYWASGAAVSAPTDIPGLAPDSFVAKSANYTITDTDGYTLILVTTGGSDVTITLPTLADNQNRGISVIKVDNGAGALVLEGEGSESVGGSTSQKVYFQYGQIDVMGTTSLWHLVQPIVETGRYTPTLSNTTNIAASTARPCNFVRTNNYVNVYGGVNVDPTSGSFTVTELGVSLPIASDLGASEDLAGVSVGQDGGQPQQSGRLIPDTTNNRAVLSFLAGSTANQDHRFNYSYIII